MFPQDPFVFRTKILPTAVVTDETCIKGINFGRMGNFVCPCRVVWPQDMDQEGGFQNPKIIVDRGARGFAWFGKGGGFKNTAALNMEQLNEFLKRVEAFAKQSHDTIINQEKKLGASLDWSREAFTLDKKRNLAVRTAFKKMYDDGLIFRGFRVVNWDPKGQTTISDDEIVYETRKTKLYTFKYSKDIVIIVD